MMTPGTEMTIAARAKIIATVSDRSMSSSNTGAMLKMSEWIGNPISAAISPERTVCPPISSDRLCSGT